MKFHLVMQSYGNTPEHRRAIFAIWSLYAQAGLSQQVTCLVFTDNPSIFEEYCVGLPLKYVLLTPEKLSTFRGSIDFVHRVKIAVIAEAFEILEGNVLYVDSDVFFIGSPLPYARRLSKSQSFMHKYEYRLGEMKDFPLPALQSFRDLHGFINSRTFAVTGDQQLQISMDQVSWNAGVIFMHRDLATYLDDVFRLTDAFYNGVKNHGCEQYAFSVVLDKYSHVDNCEDMVYHYWLPVKKPIADKFLRSRITGSWAKFPEEEKARLVRTWVKQFPKFIEQDFLMLRDNAIQAFFRNEFALGMKYAMRALLKRPFSGRFVLDVGYHMLRYARQ